jgi:hypothetical protein
MHPRTIETLGRLESASWFSRVGINEGPGVAVVMSWSQAIQHCDSDEWEDLEQEAMNQYREFIARHSKERLHLWNGTVDEVNKITRPLVDRKTAAIIRANSLPKIFKISVNYDITGVCMEAEYADMCPPGFFTNINPWYINGHFPCGWWGEFPQGKLVIY